MDDSSNNSKLDRIAFIGNYLPRHCGIATFTTDLCEAISTQYSQKTCIVLPVNDIEAGYAYPARVRFELTEKNINSYRRAADFLNINDVDLISLQHEYGIFGGRAGSHILALIRELRMPIVTTLHTILRDPDPNQMRVLKEVAALSDRLVVMSARGAEFLHDVYDVDPVKLTLSPTAFLMCHLLIQVFTKTCLELKAKLSYLALACYPLIRESRMSFPPFPIY